MSGTDETAHAEVCLLQWFHVDMYTSVYCMFIDLYTFIHRDKGKFSCLFLIYLSPWEHPVLPPSVYP